MKHVLLIAVLILAIAASFLVREPEPVGKGQPASITAKLEDSDVASTTSTNASHVRPAIDWNARAAQIVNRMKGGTYSFVSKRGTYSVDMSDLQPIEVEGNVGVEFFITARREGKPVGFGKDGSVETERIRYFFPTDDPDEFKLKVSNVIDAIAKDGSNIEKGKIGRTTSMFSPLSGNNNPSDGRCVDDTKNNWANTVNSTNARLCRSTGDDQIDIGAYVGTGSGSGNYYLGRTGLIFNTSAIPDTDEILNAYISLYVTASSTYAGPASVGHVPKTYITPFSPANDGNFTTTDFDNFTNTKLAELSFSAISAAGYTNWPFNSDGLASVSKTGNSRYYLRNDYDVDNITPVNGSDELEGTGSSGFTGHLAENTNDPILVVEHGVAPPPAALPADIIWY